MAELEALYPTEKACLAYLCEIRWPSGYGCRYCGHEKFWEVGPGKRECSRCWRQASVTAGTLFEGSHQPLRTWFRAMWYVTSQKIGVSALGLQRVLGLGSYQTAWTMLQKLRRAMVRPARTKLKGRVEVDETYWGAPEENAQGRGAQKKVLIVVGAEEDGGGLGASEWLGSPMPPPRVLNGLFAKPSNLEASCTRTVGKGMGPG
jgi:hypothetical protein